METKLKNIKSNKIFSSENAIGCKNNNKTKNIILPYDFIIKHILKKY